MADLFSTGLKVFGDIKKGNEAKKSGDRDAAQLRREAIARRGEGQHQAEEERRSAEFVKSRALAVAAASGGGVGNVNVLNTLGDIDAEGETRALMRRYSADREALGLEDAASNRQREGRAARSASRIQAATTLFTDASGKGGLWAKYQGKIGF